MISGHLSQKSNHWYMVLELRSDTGKRTPKWISTGLRVKGNKKKAEEMLYEKRLEYSLIDNTYKNARGIYFDEYMISWLNSRKNEVAKATFDSYTFIVRSNILPYFREQKIFLSNLKSIHIDAYYQLLLNRGLSKHYPSFSCQYSQGFRGRSVSRIDCFKSSQEGQASKEGGVCYHTVYN